MFVENQTSEEPRSAMLDGVSVEITAFDKTKSAVIESFDEIIKTQVSLAKQTYNNSKTIYGTTLVIIVSLLSICAVITFILSVVIIKSIVTPVKKVTTKLKEISQSNGDLTQRIDYNSKDEIGELSGNFDLFMDKLQSIISEVAVSAETISSSSDQLRKIN